MAVKTSTPVLVTPRPGRPAFIRMPTEDDLPPVRYELPEGVWLPSEDELPCDDGEALETPRHAAQAQLLLETLELAWQDRDYFAGSNMFVYFSSEQLKDRKFRGPDVFVVLDVERRERKCWVMWDEQKGPSVIIELLSTSTADVDRFEKKLVYQDELKVPVYFYCDPWSDEMAGFHLEDGAYVPLEPDSRGRWPCRPLGLSLVRWHGTIRNMETDWLRWEDPEKGLLPTAAELAQAERERAQAEREQAQAERERAQAEREQAQAERERADRLAARLRELGVEP